MNEIVGDSFSNWSSLVVLWVKMTSISTGFKSWYCDLGCIENLPSIIRQAGNEFFNHSTTTIVSDVVLSQTETYEFLLKYLWNFFWSPLPSKWVFWKYVFLPQYAKLFCAFSFTTSIWEVDFFLKSLYSFRHNRWLNLKCLIRFRPCPIQKVLCLEC